MDSSSCQSNSIIPLHFGKLPHKEAPLSFEEVHILNWELYIG